MISLVFISLGSICNALMDVTSHHFHISIFSDIQNKKILKWFRTPDSWKLKYEWDDGEIVGRKKWKGFVVPVQLTDSWHFFKMLMIVLVCCAIISYEIIVSPIVDLCLLGIFWNTTFSFYYNIIFKK
jgi:hypothetical protein